MGTEASQGLRVHLCTNPSVWIPQVEELAKATLAASEGIWTWAEFCNALIDGQVALWVVHNGEEIVGFYTTEFLPTAQGTVLNVPFAGFTRSLGALVFALNYSQDVAKQAGCVGFKWISSDNRWGSLAKRMGFTPRFVEYWKEFKE